MNNANSMLKEVQQTEAVVAEMHLAADWHDASALEKSGTRDGFGKGLVAAGEQNEEVVALTADLGESTRVHWFAEKFPERFVQVGVAEQNLVTVAAGLAASGKIPFAAGFGAFTPGRNWEQIRTTICYNNVPVQVVATHTGVTVGEDGATHQILEDIAMMRALPNMRVIVPADAAQAEKAALALASDPQPSYLRLGREKFPVFTTPDTPFEIGKADLYREGADVTVIACGVMVYEAMQAAWALRDSVSVEVINMHTVKPFDVETVMRSVAKTGAVVTAEEHQMAGGLAGAVAEVLAQHGPAPMEVVGVNDQFGESGTAAELMKHFHLTSDNIVEAIQRAFARKQ